MYVKRYEFERKSLDDLFESGRTKLENVVMERQKDLVKKKGSLVSSMMPSNFSRKERHSQ